MTIYAHQYSHEDLLDLTVVLIDRNDNDDLYNIKSVHGWHYIIADHKTGFEIKVRDYDVRIATANEKASGHRIETPEPVTWNIQYGFGVKRGPTVGAMINMVPEHLPAKDIGPIKEAFEKWLCENRGYTKDQLIKLWSSQHQRYLIPLLQDDWTLWQACYCEVLACRQQVDSLQEELKKWKGNSLQAKLNGFCHCGEPKNSVGLSEDGMYVNYHCPVCNLKSNEYVGEN